MKFENLILENVMNKAGVSLDQMNKLLRDVNFSQEFKELVEMSFKLSDWTNSHISMDNFKDAYEVEQVKVENKKIGVCNLAKKVAGIA
jgi:hypothetical protein